MTSQLFDTKRFSSAAASIRESAREPKRRDKGPLRFDHDDAANVSQAVTFRDKNNERLFRLTRADTLLLSSMLATDHTERQDAGEMRSATVPFGLSSIVQKDEEPKRFATYETKHGRYSSRHAAQEPSRRADPPVQEEPIRVTVHKEENQHLSTRERAQRMLEAVHGSDRYANQERHDRYANQERHDRYANQERHDRHASDERHDRYANQEREGNYSRDGNHDRYAKHERDGNYSRDAYKSRDDDAASQGRRVQHTRQDDAQSQRSARSARSDRERPRESTVWPQEMSDMYRESERKSDRNSERRRHPEPEPDTEPEPERDEQEEEDHSRNKKKGKKQREQDQNKRRDFMLELSRLKARGYLFEMPSESATLYQVESLFDSLTMMRITRDRVMYMQTCVRGVASIIYVVLKVLGAWWIDGWIVALSNDIQDPSNEQALEQMYVRNFGYSNPNPNYVFWFIIGQSLIMTIVANVSGNNFSGKYGREAQLKPVEKNGTARMLDPSAPEAAKEQERAPNFGGGTLPSVMQSVSGWMPSIMRGLSNTGMIGSLLGGVANMFGGRQQSTPSIRVTNPQPSMGSSSLPEFMNPSL